MNKLSKEKRSQLILVAIIVAAVIAGLWFSLIRSQQETLRSLAAKKIEDSDKLEQIANTIKNTKLTESQLQVVNKQLVYEERNMPSGDLYLSLVNTIRQFRTNYDIQITQFTPNGGDTTVNLLPSFPYRQVTVSITGTAHYHDLGKFVSDFENQFPTSRVLNLDLLPGAVTTPDTKETLAFRMDIVSLVASAGTRTSSNP